MIRVHITSLAPSGEAIDVVVSHAQAHADFPQPTGCPALAGTVSGDATIVNHQLRDPDRSAQPDSTPAALSCCTKIGVEFLARESPPGGHCVLTRCLRASCNLQRKRK